MNTRRAVIRLWVFGTVFWIAFWGWNDVRECVPVRGGVLFCPATDGDALVRTDYFHVLYFVFGPPVLSLLVGLLCWWVILRLGPKL